MAGQIYPLTPPYGLNWGHKIANFVFFPSISFILAFRALEYIIGITPDKPWYMQNLNILPWFEIILPQTMVKFCIYHGLEGVIPILT